MSRLWTHKPRVEPPAEPVIGLSGGLISPAALRSLEFCLSWQKSWCAFLQPADDMVRDVQHSNKYFDK